MYGNLELSINEGLVTYDTMVKILAILKGSCAKGCFWYKNLDLLLEGCIYLNVLARNFFFHNLTFWRYKGWGKYTLSIVGSSFSIKQHALVQGHFKVAKILIVVPYATNFSFTNNWKFTYTLANVFIFKPVVIYNL